MARKGRGWHDESRRHSLARKGIKTIHVNDAPSAKGEFRNPLSQLDVTYRLSNREYVNLLESDLQKLEKRYVDRLKEALELEGFTEDEIYDMDIEGYIQQEIFSILDSELGRNSNFHRPEELYDWLLDRVELRFHNRSMIEKIELESERGLYDDLVEIMDNKISPMLKKTVNKVESELKEMGFTEKEIKDMDIYTWQLNVLYESIYSVKN